MKILGKWKASKQRGEDLDDSVRHLADEIVRATEPPTGASLERIMQDSPAAFISFGMLQQSRRSLKAIMELNDGGLADATWGLMRTIFETTITQSWLLSDPSENLRLLLGDQIKKFRLAAEQEPSLQPLVDQYKSLMDRWTGSHDEARIPSFEDRMTDETSGYYFMYRILSAYAHASSFGSTVQFSLDSSGALGLAHVADRNAITDNLAFVASMVAIAAARAYVDVDASRAHRFTELNTRLAQVWRPPTGNESAG